MKAENDFYREEYGLELDESEDKDIDLDEIIEQQKLIEKQIEERKQGQLINPDEDRVEDRIPNRPDPYGSEYDESYGSLAEDLHQNSLT